MLIQILLERFYLWTIQILDDIIPLPFLEAIPS
jgi:hypothetical protein